MASFVSTYAQWIDPSNGFVDTFDVAGQTQARVIFCGSAVGTGQRPTVSEGMGYGLLLAVANDDQPTFDAFLRYVLGVANGQGCSLYDAQSKSCLQASPFTMPWMVDETGTPFEYMGFYTSGSASDADFQIAWAVYLASQQTGWSPSTFDTSAGTLTYGQVFDQMASAIRQQDIDISSDRYTPGNQWGAAGLTRIYPGYFTPQAFDALQTAPKPDVSIPTSGAPAPQAPYCSVSFKNDTLQTAHVDYIGSSFTNAQGFIMDGDTPTGIAPLSVATCQIGSGSSLQIGIYSSGAPFKLYRSFSGQGSQWSATDSGSTPDDARFVGSQSGQGGTFYLAIQQRNIASLAFDYDRVQDASSQAIQQFQYANQTGLFPNVEYYVTSSQPSSGWENLFGYDAIRFPLWVAAYLRDAPHSPYVDRYRTMLTSLLESVTPFVQPCTAGGGSTLPSGGVDALTAQPSGDWSVASPALNGPILLAATVLGNASLVDALGPLVYAYDITKNGPSSSDPNGDSSPYFNAAISLLTEALMTSKLGSAPALTRRVPLHRPLATARSIMAVAPGPTIAPTRSKRR